MSEKRTIENLKKQKHKNLYRWHGTVEKKLNKLEMPTEHPLFLCCLILATVFVISLLSLIKDERTMIIGIVLFVLVVLGLLGYFIKLSSTKLEEEKILNKLKGK